jgi:hypothetical protein
MTRKHLPRHLRDGLARLGADAVGPFRPTPLAWLVAEHLQLFAELRRLGAAWSQIATLLAAHGVLAGDAPVGAAVLRATYARACAEAAARSVANRNEAQHNEAQHNATKQNTKMRSAPNGNDAGQPRRTALDDIPQHATGGGADPGLVGDEADRDGSARVGAQSSLRARAKFINVPTHTR